MPCWYSRQLLSQEPVLSLLGGSNAPWPGGYPLATSLCHLPSVSEVMGHNVFVQFRFPVLLVTGLHKPRDEAVPQ